MSTQRKKHLLLTLSVMTLAGTNNVLAYPNAPSDIDQACASLGYTLVRVDAAHNCNTCHGSNQSKSAYLSANWEYFCPAPIPEPVCTDADNDGFFVEGSACGTLADFNDNDARAYPGAVEDCTDGIDNDGDGLIDTDDSDAVGCPTNCTDMDGDGASPDGGSCGPIDCNDGDPAIHPAAQEICTDGIDNNCNGNIDTADMNAVGCPITCTDNDGDGVSVEGGACGPMDCDDANPAVNPSALEICGDGIDNNCDNRLDAADSVCMSNEGTDDDEEHKPWWRKRSGNDGKGNDRKGNKRGDHDRDDDDRQDYDREGDDREDYDYEDD